MRKSASKVKKASLPVTETTVAAGDTPVQAPAQVLEPATKPARNTVKKVENKTEAEPSPAVVVEPTPADNPAPQAEVSAAVEEKPGKQSKTRKVAAPKKAKLIRDSFTFPEGDYALLTVLKQRALGAGREIKKSELLRAGLNALNAMPDAELLKVLDNVERIKTGRPSK